MYGCSRSRKQMKQTGIHNNNNIFKLRNRALQLNRVPSPLLRMVASHESCFSHSRSRRSRKKASRVKALKFRNWNMNDLKHSTAIIIMVCMHTDILLQFRLHKIQFFFVNILTAVFKVVELFFQLLLPVCYLFDYLCINKLFPHTHQTRASQISC
jgi:hypothetical protein